MYKKDNRNDLRSFQNSKERRIQNMRLKLISPIIDPEQFQGVLYWPCLGMPAKSISWIGQLKPFRRVHSFGPAPILRLFAHGLFGNLHRYFVHGFHGAGGI